MLGTIDPHLGSIGVADQATRQTGREFGPTKEVKQLTQEKSKVKGAGVRDELDETQIAHERWATSYHVPPRTEGNQQLIQGGFAHCRVWAYRLGNFKTRHWKSVRA